MCRARRLPSGVMRRSGNARLVAVEQVTMASRSMARSEKTTTAIDCLRSLRWGPLGLTTRTTSAACWCESFTERTDLERERWSLGCEGVAVSATGSSSS